MNLDKLTDGTTTTKPWLAIVAASLNAGSLAINGNPVVAGNAVSLGSAGGVSLVSDGIGPILETKGLTAGAGITLTPSGTDVTIDVAAGQFLPLAGGDMTGPVDAIGLPLDLGTVTATAVNVGQLGVITTVSGYQPSSAKFVADDQVIFGGVLTPQAMYNTGVGTLVYPANSTFRGNVVRYRFEGFFSAAALDTLTFDFLVNGVSAVSVVCTPGAIVNALVVIEGCVTLLPPGASANMFVTVMNGTADVTSGAFTLPAWDATIANTISATCQFSALTSSGLIRESRIETLAAA